ncbi:MAG: hypothetical protein AAB919_02535 [Patescibacteria group bacterium]
MTHSSLSLWVRSVAVAAAVTALALAILIVGAEQLPALKGWLKATFYHHWLGKGALGLMLFAVVAVLLRLKSSATSNLSTYILVEALAAAAAALAIAGYFLSHL